MKYNLNKLDIKTTNNFKINDLELELKLPSKFSYNKYNIKNDLIIVKEKIVNKKISSRIGLEFDKYLEVNITVPKDVIVEDTIIINCSIDNSLIEKINFNYEEGSSCNFIIKYSSSISVFHHLFNTFSISNNAHGSVSFINSLKDNSYNFISMDGNILDDGEFTHNIFDLSSGCRVYNYYSELNNNSKGYLNNIYIGLNDDLIDLNYYMKNIGKNSISNIKVEGVLNNNSLKNFRGTIDFLSGCFSSIGYENENCILLSNSAVSRSLPQMLCGEENVEGSHGVSTGSVSDDELFYLESRGLSREEALKLIIVSRFNCIISLINNSDICDYINELIDLRLN